MPAHGEQRAAAATTANIVVVLALATALLAAVAAGAGMFGPRAGEPFEFVAVRGETARIDGRGLYRYDSVFTAAGYRAQDTVTLALGLPLLLVSAVLARRGSRRAALLLTGAFGYALYVYASMALAAQYNPLFLVYVAAFSTSLFGMVLAIATFPRRALAADVSPRVPWRGPAIFMAVAGALTAVVWLSPLVAALLEGRPPLLLGHSTTKVTDALDLAIITPATIVTAALLWRHDPLGVVVAFPLLILIVLLAPIIMLSTVYQIAVGVTFTTAEIIGPVSGFSVLGLVAIGLVVAIVRAVGEPAHHAR
jgi:hypothetical protein